MDDLSGGWLPAGDRLLGELSQGCRGVAYVGPLLLEGVWVVAGRAFRYSEKHVAELGYGLVFIGRPLLLRSDPYGGSCLYLVCPGDCRLSKLR